mmetsp:Transcript_1612/g.6440  ORF Transcript_1612/g.6440 Transcript_1612/m.6440 type:complete len:229 (-) Transcript_1612:822-1508(-)
MESLKSTVSCGTTPMCRRSERVCTKRASCPPTSTSPFCASYRRYSRRSTVDLPAPLLPTSASDFPAGTVKERPSRMFARPFSEPPPYPKVTSLNSTSSFPSAGARSAGAPGASTTLGFSSSRLNMAVMSMSDCLVSRYTVPKKLRGTESWNSSPLTITRSPTVRSPRATPPAHSNIAAEMDAEKIAFWPKLSALRLDCVLSAACSYPSRHSSNRALSSFSLLKYFTVS